MTSSRNTPPGDTPGGTSRQPAHRHPQQADAGPADVTVTVSVWHNVTHDDAGRHTGYGGFHPGDQMVKVFIYRTQTRGRRPEDIAEDAFAAFNDHPRDTEGQALARQYRARRLRSLSVGDLVVVGEAALTVERAGWAPLRGAITEVRVDEHGTHPLPASRPAPRPDGLLRDKEATAHEPQG
jgi:hypothetical protein